MSTHSAAYNSLISETSIPKKYHVQSVNNSMNLLKYINLSDAYYGIFCSAHTDWSPVLFI